MTNTSHTNCTHPNTKAAREHCRGLARTKRIAAARADALLVAVDDQLDKALEIIELGAITRHYGEFFYVIGSDGTEYHTHTSGACTCPAGLRRFRAVAKIRKNGTEGATVCYHVLAARLRRAHYVH